MQTLPLSVLVGLSAHTKLYPRTSKLSSLHGIHESKEVSEKRNINFVNRDISKKRRFHKVVCTDAV